MIVPIIIDTSSLIDQYNLTGVQINGMLDNVAKTMAARFAEKLEQKAASILHQTKMRYIQSIRVVDSGKMSGTVLLDFSKDKMVSMLELGASAFDMKEGFLKSRKVKIGKKGGRYLTIPFRWGTSGIVGESDVFSGIMPAPVYKIAKSQAMTISTSGGGTRSAGLSSTTIPMPYSAALTRPTIEDSSGKVLFKAYQHKSSLYQGLIKQQDAVTKQNRYFSFRRVSENSDPDAFIHPGIQRYNLVQKTLSEFDIASQLGDQLTDELTKLGVL